MKKIEKIQVKNFKAFSGEETFSLNGKNLLVYGSNGSGKSSLYWALYTLLQSSEKTVDRINDYFAIYDENDEKTFQSLRNIFSQEEESFVEIELQGEQPIRISQENIIDVQTASAKEANKASDFINYKLLHNFYNSTHKQQVNLWKVFERDVFPYFSFNDKTFSERLNELHDNLPKNGYYYCPRNSNQYKYYQWKINDFNSNLQTKIGQIATQANKVLNEKFEITDIKILLEYSEKLKWDENKSRSFSEPEIKLIIKVKKGDTFVPIHRPQSFLNEAVLTKIAISVRLGALFTRLSDSDWKILVLDDMLISLDMSNRMIVIKIILGKKELQDFQKIILTHDKGFFDILKSEADSSEWEYLEFSKSEASINSKLTVKNNKTELERAKDLFNENEFEACANYLRKAAEKTLRHYLNKELKNEFESLSNLIGQAKNQINAERIARFNKLFEYGTLPLEKLKDDLDTDTTLTLETKGQLKSLINRLVDFLMQQSAQEVKFTKILDELKSIKDRILNPGSHVSATPLYSQELQEAIKIVEDLHKLLTTKQ